MVLEKHTSSQIAHFTRLPAIGFGLRDSTVHGAVALDYVAFAIRHVVHWYFLDYLASSGNYTVKKVDVSSRKLLCAMGDEDDGTGMRGWIMMEEEDIYEYDGRETDPRAAALQAVPHVPVPAEVQRAERHDYQALDDASFANHVMLICGLYMHATSATPLPDVLDPQKIAKRPTQFDF